MKASQIDRFELPCCRNREFVDRLRKTLLRMRSKTRGLPASNRGGGWHSGRDLHKLPLFSQVVRELEIEAALLASAAVQVHGAWANINPQRAWNLPHAHPAYAWVALLMLSPITESELDEGALLIQRNHDHFRAVSPPLRVGEVLLFSGTVMHMVAPHYQNRYRISVAFNLQPKD